MNNYLKKMNNLSELSIWFKDREIWNEIGSIVIADIINLSNLSFLNLNLRELYLDNIEFERLWNSRNEWNENWEVKLNLNENSIVCVD